MLWGYLLKMIQTSPDINSGDRIYINTGWSPELTKVRQEALVRRIKHNTLWLLEILYNEHSFQEKSFVIAKANNDDKKLTFYNNHINLDLDNVNILGRVVQIVKEI